MRRIAPLIHSSYEEHQPLLIHAHDWKGNRRIPLVNGANGNDGEDGDYDHDATSLMECARKVLVELQTDGIEAWSHLIAAAFFMAFALLRSTSGLFVTDKLSGSLATVACVMYALMFTASTLYHISVPCERIARWMLDVDYATIILSFSMSTIADTALVYRERSTPPWQTWGDFIAAPVFLVGFFLVRPSGIVGSRVFGYQSTDGATARNPGDGAVASLHTRISLNVCILLSWLLISSAIVMNIRAPANWVLFSAYAFGTTTLLLARMNDYMELTEKCLTPVTRMTARRRVVRTCGEAVGAPSPHLIWHVLGIVCAVYMVAAREYALFSFDLTQS